MSSEAFAAGGWIFAAGVLSWYLTGRARRYAISRRVLDIPNARSLHSLPTPRGGGIAVAGTVLGLIVIQALAGLLPANVAAALLGGGSLLALVGWVDDRWGTPAVPRLGAHALAAVWGVYWLGSPSVLTFGTAQMELGALGFPVACLGVVWLINLYNFMDGIDGLAGGEAAAVGVAAGALLYLRGSPDLALVSATVAGASAGFLVWNWPPARIFLGDAGSGLLGYVFAVLALASERSGSVPAVVWAVLLGVFLVDSTMTLVRRMLRRDRIVVAHKTHAYQRAVEGGLSHRQVTTGILLLNAALAAAAYAVALRPALTAWITAGALALLLVCYGIVEMRNPMAARRA